MKIDFYKAEEIDDEKVTFVVIVSRYEDKWIVVRHQERSTWEIPGGHREELEDLKRAAERELYEETGAKQFNLIPICVYSVKINERCSYGKLFYAEIKELGKLPELEIAEIKFVDDILKEHLTYPLIQPLLFIEVQKYLLKRTI